MVIAGIRSRLATQMLLGTSGVTDVDTDFRLDEMPGIALSWLDETPGLALLGLATTGELRLTQPPPEMIDLVQEMPKTGNVVVRCGCYPGLDVVA